MADETTHGRPTQAEEPADDMGASNVDLDEARHGPAHSSPAEPEPSHEPDDVANLPGHDEHAVHDDDDDHPVDDPRWVLAPLAFGVVAAIVILVVVGLNSGAAPFHQF